MELFIGVPFSSVKETLKTTFEFDFINPDALEDNWISVFIFVILLLLVPLSDNMWWLFWLYPNTFELSWFNSESSILKSSFWIFVSFTSFAQTVETYIAKINNASNIKIFLFIINPQFF